jgi:hypothetical protein
MKFICTPQAYLYEQDIDIILYLNNNKLLFLLTDLE